MTRNTILMVACAFVSFNQAMSAEEGSAKRMRLSHAVERYTVFSAAQSDIIVMPPKRVRPSHAIEWYTVFGAAQPDFSVLPLKHVRPSHAIARYTVFSAAQSDIIVMPPSHAKSEVESVYVTPAHAFLRKCCPSRNAESFADWLVERNVYTRTLDKKNTWELYRYYLITEHRECLLDMTQSMGFNPVTYIDQTSKIKLAFNDMYEFFIAPVVHEDDSTSEDSDEEDGSTSEKSSTDDDSASEKLGADDDSTSGGSTTKDSYTTTEDATV